MENLGKVFREFRMSKNYSLKEAAGEACSTSQLSRFELGESDLAASRFFDILDNIHVTIENFMDKARNFQHHEHVALMAQIIPLYYANDIAGFQRLQGEQLEKAKRSTNPLYFELNWILLQGLICQRDTSYTMKQRVLLKVLVILKPMWKRLSARASNSTSAMSFITSRDLPSIRRGKQKKGVSKCKRLCIFLMC